jgi:hypothetical protein
MFPEWSNCVLGHASRARLPVSNPRARRRHSTQLHRYLEHYTCLKMQIRIETALRMQ